VSAARWSALALVATCSAVACGGGQTRLNLFSTDWTDDGGASIDRVWQRVRATPIPPAADVVIGVATNDHKIIGLPLAGGSKWVFEHPLDARPAVRRQHRRRVRGRRGLRPRRDHGTPRVEATDGRSLAARRRRRRQRHRGGLPPARATRAACSSPSRKTARWSVRSRPRRRSASPRPSRVWPSSRWAGQYVSVIDPRQRRRDGARHAAPGRRAGPGPRAARSGSAASDTSGSTSGIPRRVEGKGCDRLRAAARAARDAEADPGRQPRPCPPRRTRKTRRASTPSRSPPNPARRSRTATGMARTSASRWASTRITRSSRGSTSTTADFIGGAAANGGLYLCDESRAADGARREQRRRPRADPPRRAPARVRREHRRGEGQRSAHGREAPRDAARGGGPRRRPAARRRAEAPAAGAHDGLGRVGHQGAGRLGERSAHEPGSAGRSPHRARQPPQRGVVHGGAPSPGTTTS